MLNLEPTYNRELEDLQAKAELLKDVFLILITYVNYISLVN